jgi:hypothetical protein
MLRAARLPGRTASVAVALWAAATASGLSEVTLTPARLREIEVGRESAYAAVERMVEAGLVSADRQQGRAVRLTLLDGMGLPLRVNQMKQKSRRIGRFADSPACGGEVRRQEGMSDPLS